MTVRFALALVSTGLALACRGDPPIPPLRPDADLAVHRLLAREGELVVAWFDPARLPSLVIRSELPADAELEVRIGETRARMELAPAGEGAIRVRAAKWKDQPPPPGSGTIHLSSSQQTIEWSRPIRWTDAPEARREVNALAKAAKELALDKFLSEAQPMLAAAGPELLPWLLAEVARAHQVAGDARGAAEAWERRAPIARAAGLGTEESRSLRAASFNRVYAGDLVLARSLLERAWGIDEELGNEEGLARSAASLGRIELEFADFRRSIEWVERSISIAEHGGLALEFHNGKVQLAIIWTAQGLHEPALHTIAAVEPWFQGANVPVLERAAFLVNAGWIQLIAILQGQSSLSLDQPRRLLEEAAELRRREKQTVPEAHARVNLAYTALAQRDFAACREALMRARQLSPGVTSFSERFMELIDAELALVEGDARVARATFERITRRARQDGEPDNELIIRALDGQGRAAIAGGDRVGAVAAWKEALAVEDALASKTRLLEHRAPFFAERGAIEERTFDALMKDRRHEEAFVLLDDVGSRIARSLESNTRLERLDATERETWDALAARYSKLRQQFEAAADQEWKLDGAELDAFRAQRRTARAELTRAFDDAYAHLERAAPVRTQGVPSISALQAALQTRQALLLIFGAHGFYVDAGGLSVANIAGGGLLDPWSDRLRAIDHLFIVPGTSIAAWSLTSAERSISFLRHAGWLLRDAKAPSAEARPLIVLDPTGDLPFARAEGRSLEVHLPGATALEGGRATRANVLEALAQVSTFHFTGHGVVETTSPWDAHLLLAGRERLTISDVILRGAAPAVTVLSGCDTGLSLALAGRERVSIADAFLISGGRSVLATTQPLSDERTARFIAAFYEHEGARAPGAALVAATAQAIRENNPVWSAFRLLGRP